MTGKSMKNYQKSFHGCHKSARSLCPAKRQPKTWHKAGKTFLERFSLDFFNFKILINPFFFSGMHHHDSLYCDSSRLVTKVQNLIQNAAKSGLLYPKNLKLSRTYDEDDVSDNLKPNGGWSDLRDILLCLNITLSAR